MKFIFRWLMITVFSLSASAAEVYETTVREMGFKSTNRTVIDEETIRNSKATDVTSLLQTQANIAVSSTSFQPNMLSLRGGDASHILILVDGVPLYDPGTAQRALNLNTLNLKNIRRIEVLRGAQTVLYGGQALAGVIKIETFGREVKGIYGVGASAGSFAYKDLSVVAQKAGETEALRATVNGSSKDRSSPLLGSQEVYVQSNLNADLAYTSRGHNDFVLRLFSTEDTSYMPSLAANFRTIDAKDFLLDTSFKGTTASWRNYGASKLEVAASWAMAYRKFAQPLNSTNVWNQEIDEVYNSQLQNIRAQFNAFETEQWQVQLGGSYFKESFVFRKSGAESANSFGEQRGVFSKVDFSPDDNYHLEVGARADSTTSYNSEISSQVGLILFQNTRLEYATAFRTPSQFQYFGSYGNRDLEPERATSYSVTQDVKLTSTQAVSVGLFQIDFSKLITTKTVNFLPKYFNVSRAQVRGVEMLYAYQNSSDFKAQFRVTHQDPRDQDTNARLLRRPLNSGGVTLSQGWQQQSAGIELVYEGDREAQVASLRYKMLSDYSLINLFWNWDVAPQMQTYVRVNNLTDTRYEESYDYFHEGRGANFGLNYMF